METKTTVIFLAAAAMLAGTSSLAFAQNNSDYGTGYGNRQQNEEYGPDSGYNNRHERFNRGDQDYRNQSNGTDEEYGRGRNESGSRDLAQDQADRNRLSARIPNHIRRQLRQEGFSSIHIAPGSYVVNAEDSNGDPVLMMIGPHSATMFRSLSNQNQNANQKNSGEDSRSKSRNQRSQQNSSSEKSAQSSDSQSNCPDEMAFLQNPNNSNITSAEHEKVRDKVFNSLDEDGDGKVSRDEYVRCLVQTPAFKPAGNGAKAVK